MQEATYAARACPHPPARSPCPLRRGPRLSWGGPSSHPLLARRRPSTRLDQRTQNCAIPGARHHGQDREDEMEVSTSDGQQGQAPAKRAHSGEERIATDMQPAVFLQLLEHKCHEQFSFKPQYTRYSKRVPGSSFPPLTQPCSPSRSWGSWKLLRRSPGDFLDKPASLSPREQPPHLLSNKNFQVTQLLHRRGKSIFNESLT